MYKTSEIDIAKIELFTGNVFYITTTAGAEIDLEAAKRFVRATNALLPDDVDFRSGVYDISKIAYIHEDARTYFAEGVEIKGTVAAVALISHSFLGTTVGNMFLSLSGPRKYPVKMFNSPIRAEHWVRTELKLRREEAEKKRISDTEHRNVA